MAPVSPTLSATSVAKPGQRSRDRLRCAIQPLDIAWPALAVCALFLITLTFLKVYAEGTEPRALTVRWAVSPEGRKLSGTIGACVCASQAVALLFSAGASSGTKRAPLLAAALFCGLAMITFVLDLNSMLFQPWSLELSIYGLVVSSSMLGYYITGSLIRLQRGADAANALLRESRMWLVCVYVYAWPVARYILELWPSPDALPVAAVVDALVLAGYAVVAHRATQRVQSVLKLHWTVALAGAIVYIMWITGEVIHFLVAAGYNIPPDWTLHSLMLLVLSFTTLLSMYTTQAIISFEESTRFKAERDAAQAELATRIQQQQQAQAAEEARQKFLRYVFHEIRVPFNSIDMGLGMLVEDVAAAEIQAEGLNGDMFAALNGGIILPEDAKATIEIMTKAAASMKVIINDTLDWTKLQSGAFQISLGPARLADVVSGTMVGLSAFALHPDNKVKLVQEIDPRLPPWLLADKVRLQQVVANFLSNAIKFAPHDGTGVVTLKVHVVDGGHGSDWTDPLGMVQPVKDFASFNGAGIWWKGTETAMSPSVSSVDLKASAAKPAGTPAAAGLATPSSTGPKSPKVVVAGTAKPAVQAAPGSPVPSSAGGASLKTPALNGSTGSIRRAPSFRHGLQETPVALPARQAGPPALSANQSLSVGAPPALRTGGWSQGAGAGTANSQQPSLLKNAPSAWMKRLSGSVRHFAGVASPSSAANPPEPKSPPLRPAGPARAIIDAALPQLQVPEIQPALVIKNMLEGFTLRPAAQGGSVVSMVDMATRTHRVPSAGVGRDDTVKLHEEQVCTLVISVQDNGDGISADEVPTLFRAFKQLDAGMQYKGKGTGLGLAICHEIVSLHGGRVGVRSSGKKGGGAEFLIALRLPVLIRDGPSSARSGTREHTFAEAPLPGLRASSSEGARIRGIEAMNGQDSSDSTHEQVHHTSAPDGMFTRMPTGGIENVLMNRSMSMGMHGGHLPGSAAGESQPGSRRASLTGQPLSARSQGQGKSSYQQHHEPQTSAGGLSITAGRRFSAHLADDRAAGIGAGPPAIIAAGSPIAQTYGQGGNYTQGLDASLGPSQAPAGQGSLIMSVVSPSGGTSRVRAMVEEDALRMRSPMTHVQLSPESRTREVHEEMMRRATAAAQLAADAMSDPDSLVIPLSHGLHGTLTVGSGARMLHSMSIGPGATAADVSGMVSTPGQTSALPCMCVPPGGTADSACPKCHRHQSSGSSSTFRLTQVELDRLLASEGLMGSPLAGVVRHPIGLQQARGPVHSGGTPQLAHRAPSLSHMKAGRNNLSTGSSNGSGSRPSNLQHTRGPSVGSNGPGDGVLVPSLGSSGASRTILPLPGVQPLPHPGTISRSTGSTNSRGDTPGQPAGAESVPLAIAPSRRPVWSTGSDAMSVTYIPTMPPMGEHPREPSGWSASGQDGDSDEEHEALVVHPSDVPGGLAPLRSSQPLGFARKLALSTIEEIATPGLSSTSRSTVPNSSAREVLLGASGTSLRAFAAPETHMPPVAGSPTVDIPVGDAAQTDGLSLSATANTANNARAATSAASTAVLAEGASAGVQSATSVHLTMEPEPGPLAVIEPEPGPLAVIPSKLGLQQIEVQVHQGPSMTPVTEEGSRASYVHASTVSVAPAPAERVLRILMVDDVADNRRLLHRALKRRLEAMLPKHVAPVRWRIEVDEAEDGHIAVSMVTGRAVENLSTPDCPACSLAEEPKNGPPAGRYDVITMDAEMPVLSGFRATQLIRAAGYTGLLYGCTGNALEEDQQLFRTRGANNVYIKPLDIAAIATAICDRLREQGGASSTHQV